MMVAFECNGRPVTVAAEPLDRLLDVLRDTLGLTGAKDGCGEGECGSCTVLLDGAPVVSCLLPVAHVSGHRVTTIEGVAAGRELSAVQRALWEEGGVQCGSCTPGIVLSVTAALAREPGASRERLRELLAGNLCRCTGYQRVLDAAVVAATGAAS